MTSKTISKKAASKKKPKRSIKKVKNALVLSGGGTRGFAHMGVIEVLEEHNLHPDFIVGCSVGALIGVCYAAGKSISDIKDFFLDLSMYKLLRPKWRSGLFNTEKVVDEVLSFAQVKNFEDLQFPVLINATNINNGLEQVFSTGRLKPALQASIAVPGIFAPVKIGTKIYVDGGISNPLPVHLVPKAKNIFVVDVAFKFEKITQRTNPLTVLKNAIFSLQKQSLNKITPEMIYIHPPLQEFDLYDYSTKDRKKMLSRGKSAAKKALKNL